MKNININTICSNSSTNEFTLTFTSNQLNLSENAIIDNLGGYVDIPEDSYYLKTNTNIYKLDGIVESNQQFTVHINDTSENFINTKELYTLHNNNNIQFIQKINLEENHTTTNILGVNFNPSQIKQEYKSCKQNTAELKQNNNYDIAIILIGILILLYIFKSIKR